MWWVLCYLSATLVLVTRAQTIDDSVVVEPELIPVIPANHNSIGNDEVYPNNAAFNKDNSELLQSSDWSKEDPKEDGIQIVVPKPIPLPSSDSSASSSRQTRETNENNHRSNEPVGTPGSQNASPENITASDETTTESFDLNNTTDKTNSSESKEGGISVEIFSIESPGTEETNSTSPPIGASIEGDGGQNSQDVTDAAADVVLTTHGPVRGFQWRDNTEIMAFYDIPYGTFKRPFEPPATAESWANIGVHEATHHTKICPQIENDEYIGDENCLTLSIFTPKNAENASVLFHIYDGHSNCKSADPLMYGPDYLVSKGLILVLPNYRTGPLGFLCMQNETAPGNAGLKDLSLALEWVKDNIHLFGGNPDNIVVSGDGDAGAYAGYLALCSKTNQYINKVITESGSALSHMALDRDPVATAYKLANKLTELHADGIIFNNTFDEMALETILRAAEGIRFMPCIDADKEPLLDDTPWKIIQNRDIKATFMIGSATYAGTHEATDMTVEFVEEINKHFDLLLPEDLVFKDDEERDSFAHQLRKQYFGNDSITVRHVDELSLWYTDASYLSPGIRLARPLVAAGATVYLYEFAYVGSLNWALEDLKKPVQGAVRGDLVGYLFRKTGADVTEDSADERMIDVMVDLWTSFINTGKPAAADVEWRDLKAGEADEEEWLYISAEPKLKRGVHVERLRLWTELYQRHFIDNAAPAATGAPTHLVLALICLMANKLNYDSH